MSLGKSILARMCRHFCCIPLFLGILASGSAIAAGGSRDVLLELVTTCINMALPDYCSRCRIPRIDAACGAMPACRQSTEIWALDSRHVALRDRKMCDCPAGFVHGLAIPLDPVRGVEDPVRPDGIWQFAWDVARARIAPDEIALVVNPVHARSQDQLHVHLVRLRPDMAAEVTARTVARIEDLAEVWRVAAHAAAERDLQDYGVLVARHPEGGFRVVVMADTPEKALTEWQCAVPTRGSPPR